MMSANTEGHSINIGSISQTCVSTVRCSQNNGYFVAPLSLFEFWLCFLGVFGRDLLQTQQKSEDAWWRQRGGEVSRKDTIDVSHGPRYQNCVEYAEGIRC